MEEQDDDEKEAHPINLRRPGSVEVSGVQTADAEDEEEEDDGLVDEPQTKTQKGGVKNQLLPPPGWQNLLKWAAAALGLRWGAYFSLRGIIGERFARRLITLGCSDLEEYRRLLHGSGDGDATSRNNEQL